MHSAEESESDAEPSRRIEPSQWPWALSSPPATSSERSGWRTALLRQWLGTAPVMRQPPLDHHYVVMHLGGAKRVERRKDGPAVCKIVDDGSLTLVPAGTTFTWRTRGPIAFAHLYIRPDQLGEAIRDVCERDAAGATLRERVGCRDPVLEPLLTTMLTELASATGPSMLRLDLLFNSFLVHLARSHSSGAPVRDRPITLAPHRLQRVLEFIEVNLSSDVSLSDLVEAASSSRFHFCHAFQAATGCSPYRYLVRRRIELARALLITSSQPIAEVATRCGFNSRHQFAVMFKREVGVSPKRFRAR